MKNLLTKVWGFISSFDVRQIAKLIAILTALTKVVQFAKVQWDALFPKEMELPPLPKESDYVPPGQ